MQQAYLFVHFREMCTPDGEQLRFALSRDGFHWEAVNEGRPLLWAYYGDKACGISPSCAPGLTVGSTSWPPI